MSSNTDMSSDSLLPYGRQSIDEEDIAAVCEVLRSDWLTTGPAVERFEHQVADYVGVKHAVAVSSGTAALHAAMFAVDVKPGDQVIIPAITFVATANAVLFQGGTPVFADVDEDTLLLDPACVADKITAQTRAIVPVDYAGQACDYPAIAAIAGQAKLPIVADGSHSLGGGYAGRPCGSLADLTTFSFHPVKPLTTGEGGMVTTDDGELAARMRTFRNHGIDIDHHERSAQGVWQYRMEALGYNYRLTDIQAALGCSQLKKLPDWIARRQSIARRYDRLFSESSLVTPLTTLENRQHGYHLYVVRVRGGHRDDLLHHLRAKNIRTAVHYEPVYLHPYYRTRFNYENGHCPVAEAAAEQILSLPIFPALGEADIQRTVDAILEYADRTNSDR